MTVVGKVERGCATLAEAWCGAAGAAACHGIEGGAEGVIDEGWADVELAVLASSAEPMVLPKSAAPSNA